MTTIISFSLKCRGSREDLRTEVIQRFLDEKPGTGSGDQSSRYRYDVEVLSDGSRVYLTRPAYLKKGFDFLIHVENMAFLTGKDFPKFDDVFHDLRAKHSQSAGKAKRVLEAIERLYKCEDPDDILADYRDLVFDSGYQLELLLKVIKWFFIEQDIRDWNYSGRAMFMGHVREVLS